MGVKFTLKLFVAGTVFGVLAALLSLFIPGILQNFGYPEPMHGFWGTLITAFGVSIIVTLLTGDLGFFVGTVVGIVVAFWVLQKMSKKEKEDGER